MQRSGSPPYAPHPVGCSDLAIRDTSSLLLPRFQRSEVLGFVAGLMGLFQIAWVYYGLLIQSRPVIAWNVIAVVINFLTVRAYYRFVKREREEAASSASAPRPRG